ncbi:TetR/AcrR family transcriptional regulator [Arthrobacter sp. C9C5]|uniref:TetR/AcrR family transcriptional regulator n=1 Tax=Arthrobacter sp. C9C5 TaxID=2735267 RepID=UPI001585CF61|nr:TetR/AcrR family transcriptional regulator [Arthrobacter sp. C9C5]NUU31960.1 TetR/AcrR family transcriptional regulator [Arthrobacter sp. C9C5]
MNSRPDEIIDAAYVCFTRHGARRTTMHDLAEEAGISRAALYQYFRNKEDVFRALVERLLAGALSASERAAEMEGLPEARLAGILSAKLGLVMQIWRDSPAHAAELLGVDTRLSSDVLGRYDEAMLGLLTRTVQDSYPAADAPEAAEILLAFTRGLEAGVSDPAALPERLRRGVEVFVAGLNNLTPMKEQP